MPHHVVVDGSNIATEGRDRPSLRQLNEAVMAYMAEHPEALITVVVDATFGHRIDPKEVAEFDEAVNNNELVAPPAGAIGRGDAFVLSIANKVNATILTNDSYQEFHGEYEWLFDEGRLVGGKPVPHIGWVFVNRLPVRGPVSRKSTSEAKKKSRSKSDSGSVRVGSVEASRPMPVPTAPPPGAKAPKQGRGHKAAADAAPAKEPQEARSDAVAASAAVADAKAGQRHGPVNDVLPFLTFVERHPLGTSVNAIVDHYSSHGAYVKVGDVTGYVPLRLMADPAPRSAREFMKVGEAITLVVEKFLAEKRSIDLAVPGMGSVPPIEHKPAKAEKAPKPAKAAKGTKKAAAVDEPAPAEVPADAAAESAAPKRSRSKKAAKPVADAVEAPSADTAPAAPAKRSSKKAAPATVADDAPAAPAKRAAKKAAAKPAMAAAAPAAEPQHGAPSEAAPKRSRAKKAATTTEAPAAAPAAPAKAPARRVKKAAS